MKNLQIKYYLIVAILLFSFSCFSQSKEINIKFRDTIILSKNEFEIKSNKDFRMEIKILDSLKFKKIKDSFYPIIKIEINNEFKTAKSLHVLGSNIPENCDFFFPVNNKGYPMFFQGLLYLSETSPHHKKTKK